MQTIGKVLVLLFTIYLISVGGYETYRLPNVYKTEHYDLRILTHLQGPEQLSFEGQVKINFHVLDETRNITLHAKNLTIVDQEITLLFEEENNCILRNEFDEDKEFLVLHLCKDLQKSKPYRLSISFKAPLGKNQTGYYSSSYNESATTHYLSATQFSPTFARMAFPCFDEPNLKATFRVTLGYHRDYTGLSNTPIRQCRDHESLKDYIWCEHETLFRTSTYLVAYAVHNFQPTDVQSSTTINNVTFSSWMQPNVVPDGHFLANFAPKVLESLEKRFDYPFPLRKIDQLAVPTHKFQAMENWGLVTFKEIKFVHNDKEELMEVKELKAKTMAHEYAHQWFGNLVTMAWWQDLWLKEGPSTYFAYLTMDALLPDWSSGERLIALDLDRFFRQDAINSTIAISRDVQGSANILKHFSEYVYEKGSLTMRMLHKVLGDEAFYMGIKHYIRQHVYGNVMQSDMWNAMEDAAIKTNVLPSDIRLSTVMNSWTLQEGYPIVNVTRDYVTGSVSVTQSRFWLPDGSSTHPETCWWTPLTFVSESQNNFNATQAEFWLECPKSEIRLRNMPENDKWIILNPQVNTIYRVDYDIRNWNLIIQSLNSAGNLLGGIHVLNRAQLMDDLMMLAWANLRSYELALSMLEYLPREQHVTPWKRILNLLNKHGNLLVGQQARVYRNFMRTFIRPLYQRYSSYDAEQMAASSNHDVSLYRLAFDQACRFGVEDCITQMLRLRSDNPVNIRDVLYCVEVEHGDQMTFESMMKEFQNSSILARRSALAIGLGCSREFKSLQEFLDYLLSSTDATIGSYYVDTAISALERKHVPQQITEHIQLNAKILNDKLSAKDCKRLLLTLIDNNEISEDDLKELIKLEKFEEAAKIALDNLNVNQIWIKHRSNEFIEALQKYV